jgi:hypothetical protein
LEAPLLDSPASCLFSAHRRLVAVLIAFRPAAVSFRLGFEVSGVAFDVGSTCFTGGFFFAPDDACELTASFARVTATLAS